MRVLVALQGDSSKKMTDIVHLLLDFEEHQEVLGYLPLVITPERLQVDAATVTQLGIEGDGRQVGSQRVAVGDVDSAVRLAKAFVKQHARPVRDARALLTEAQKDAKRTGRRVWIVFSGPRCGPCFLLARWMEDQHTLLGKDYVVLKLGRHEGAWEIREELKRPAAGGIPWMAITEPDGTVLVTSYGPLGNIGFPTEFEDLRHLNEMLSRTAQRLTAEELERIVRSRSKLEE
jgi:hypothetical protein